MINYRLEIKLIKNDSFKETILHNFVVYDLAYKTFLRIKLYIDKLVKKEK